MDLVDGRNGKAERAGNVGAIVGQVRQVRQMGQVRQVRQMGRGENFELGTSCKLAPAGVLGLLWLTKMNIIK